MAAVSGYLERQNRSLKSWSGRVETFVRKMKKGAHVPRDVKVCVTDGRDVIGHGIEESELEVIREGVRSPTFILLARDGDPFARTLICVDAINAIYISETELGGGDQTHV